MTLRVAGGASLTATRQLLPFSGRHAEVALLRRLLKDPPEERPAALAIQGPAGTGKTRLLREGLVTATEGCATTLVCTCRRLQQPVPYWPLQAAWRTSRGGAAPDVATPADPAAAVETWAARLAGAADGPPTLLVLDAAQWADPWTLRVLDALLSATFGPPPLLWIAWRPRERTAELAVLLDEAERAHGCLPLSVDTLTETEVQQALAEHLPAEEARALATWGITATAGLPDLLAVTVDALAADGVVRVDGARWHLDRARLQERYTPDTLPAPAGALLRRRLDDLPAPAREVVEVIAVVGGSIAPALLERACGAAGADALDDLLTMRLVRVLDDEWGTHYRLSVPALAGVALGAVSSARRERLKARVEGA